MWMRSCSSWLSSAVAATAAAVSLTVAGSRRQGWEFGLSVGRCNSSSSNSVVDDAAAEAAADAAEAAAKAADESGSTSVTNEHTAKWRVYTDLARDLAAQKKHAQAQRYLQRARQEAIRGFGADDAHVAAAIQNEAEFLRVQRRYEDAEPLYKEAMDRLEAVLGRNSVPWAVAAHNAAALYTAKKDFETAKELYEAALKVKMEIFGLQSMETAMTIFRLSELMYAEGKREDALSMLKQALASVEEAGLVNNADYAKMLSKLATMLQQEESIREAQTALERLLTCLESGEGVWNHFSARIRVCLNLASLHRTKDEIGVSVSYARSADALLEKFKEDKADVTESPVWLQNKLRVLFLLLDSDDEASVGYAKAQLSIIEHLVKDAISNRAIKDDRIQLSLQEELSRVRRRADLCRNGSRE